MNAEDLGYRCASPDRPTIVPAPEVVATPLPGCAVQRLRWHADERGALCELHRESWRDGGGISKLSAPQVYVSETEPGVVKGWHLHPPGIFNQTDRFACVAGRVRLVLVDLRRLEASEVVEALARVRQNPSFAWSMERIEYEEARVLADQAGARPVEILLDPARSMLRVEIPPGVAHGWIALGNRPALVVNAVSREYDGQAEWRCDPHGPPAPGLPVYDWRAYRDG